jgi:hypothetical protein
VGKRYSPLLVGRFVLNFGQPEQENYRIAYETNYYNRRKGLSVGLGGAYQGKTDLFGSSAATSIDILLNYGPFNLDAEYNLMIRTGDFGPTGLPVNIRYASGTGHLRTTYNLVLADRFFLEPSFMIMRFDGGTNSIEQSNAVVLGAFSGEETTYDVGINWYINRKHLRLMLHYTWREGNAGDAGEGALVNQYFVQSSVGPIQRGNWWGLGLNAIF